MKLHRNLLLAIVDGLKQIFIENKQADSTVERILTSNTSWGARDRNFIAENIYEIVRYKRRYTYLVGTEINSEETLWKMLGIKLFTGGFLLTGIKEFEGIDEAQLALKTQEAKAIRKVWESLPDWLDELCEKELGAQWSKEIVALNTPAKLSVRVNTLKSNRNTLKTLFTADGINCEEAALSPDGLVILQRKNFRSYPAYKNGLFEIQDISSQLVAPALNAEPGMTVIDGCAGAGGKTLHIAALMKNKGKIFVVDIGKNKLDELRKRATRAGASTIHAMVKDDFKTYVASISSPFADRILLDVPCSGMGILRRKPDAKWALTPAFIEELKKTQAFILDEHAPMLKVGGIMVYSTCSLLPSENNTQVQAFIERNKGTFELLGEQSISPANSGFDGFYIARLKKVK